MQEKPLVILYRFGEVNNERQKRQDLYENVFLDKNNQQIKPEFLIIKPEQNSFTEHDIKKIQGHKNIVFIAHGNNNGNRNFHTLTPIIKEICYIRKDLETNLSVETCYAGAICNQLLSEQKQGIKQAYRNTRILLSSGSKHLHWIDYIGLFSSVRNPFFNNEKEEFLKAGNKYPDTFVYIQFVNGNIIKACKQNTKAKYNNGNVILFKQLTSTPDISKQHTKEEQDAVEKRFFTDKEIYKIIKYRIFKHSHLTIEKKQDNLIMIACLAKTQPYFVNEYINEYMEAAIQTGNKEIVEMLLQNCNCYTWLTQKKYLDLAAIFRQLEILKLLIFHPNTLSFSISNLLSELKQSSDECQKQIKDFLKGMLCERGGYYTYSKLISGKIHEEGAFKKIVEKLKKINNTKDVNDLAIYNSFFSNNSLRIFNGCTISDLLTEQLLLTSDNMAEILKIIPLEELLEYLEKIISYQNHLAYREKFKTIIKQVIIKFPSYIDKNPLHLAIENGLTKTALFLIEHVTALINQPDSSKKPVIALAISVGNDGVVDYLLKNGADPFAKDNDVSHIAFVRAFINSALGNKADKEITEDDKEAYQDLQGIYNKYREYIHENPQDFLQFVNDNKRIRKLSTTTNECNEEKHL